MAFLNHIAVHLPVGTLSNEELGRRFPEWSVEKIARKTGILNRHIAADDETAGDLAFAAAQKLFADSGYDPSLVDFVLLCTQSPDYFLPTTACILQDRLGLSQDCGALDFNLGCSGYVYGLGLAKGLIATGQAKSVLLLTGETYSKHLNPRRQELDHHLRRRASASIVSDEPSGYRIDHFAYGTDGSGFDKLITRTGAFRRPKRSAATQVDEYGNAHSADNLYMDGPGVFAFTIDGVPKIIQRMLAVNDLEDAQISRYVFHQANNFMLSFLRNKLKNRARQICFGLSRLRQYRVRYYSHRAPCNGE